MLSTSTHNSKAQWARGKAAGLLGECLALAHITARLYASRGARLGLRLGLTLGLRLGSGARRSKVNKWALLRDHATRWQLLLFLRASCNARLSSSQARVLQAAQKRPSTMQLEYGVQLPLLGEFTYA